jgi:hypothetical protein
MANNAMLSLHSLDFAGRVVVRGEGSGLAQIGESAGSALSLLDSTPDWAKEGKPMTPVISFSKMVTA